MVSTLPPSPAEQEGISKFEAMIKDYERKRRTGESGLMRALALSWAMGKTEGKNP